MLDSNERVISKHFSSKSRTVATTQSFTIESSGITLEKLLDDVEDRRLACTSGSVEDDKFLDLFESPATIDPMAHSILARSQQNRAFPPARPRLQ
jgi:hypothetical protein